MLTRKRMITIISAAVILTVIAVMTVCFNTCGRGNSGEESSTGVTSATEKPAETVETDGTDVPEETEATTATVSEWDGAILRWDPQTVLRFELRVKPGFVYELTPDDDCGCTFETGDGTLYAVVQGMDYENTFEMLINYFKSCRPEKLSVGENTMTIIVVYDSDRAEICSKLSDTFCLTVKAADVETAERFFSTVMIQVEGEDYSPLDKSDVFDELDLNL